LKVFNSFHPRLQFIIEVSEGDRLNFLDVTLIKMKNNLIFDWYHKSTFSGRYLNFLSQHPLSQKRATIIGLTDRAILPSHPNFQQKNLCLIINILLNNNYPLDLIFLTIYNRLKYLFVSRINNTQNTQDESENSKDSAKKFFTIPYVPSISESFKKIIGDLDVNLSFCSLNTLHRFIKAGKDTLTTASHGNIVYKIECNNCDASYVGQTGRELRTRIDEHRNHIRRNAANHSVITDHRLEFNHDFNWIDVKILNSEPNFNKRLISEMLFIKRQNNGLNLQTDTEGLHEVYVNVG